MKINSNITAYTTNNAYLINERRLSGASARLSSGSKINKAGDDPANYAIGSKMRAQLEALDKIKTNATTGSSVVETAESAVTEIQSMIQRMSELAIKAANGTMSSSDRSMIQEEVDQLKDEISRISSTTEFNSMTLLDGGFENKGYCRNVASVKVEQYSDQTSAGTYSMKLSYKEGYSLSSYGVSGDVYDVFGTIYPKISDVEYDEGTGEYSVTVSSESEGGAVTSRTYTMSKTELDTNKGKMTFSDTKDASKKITLEFDKVYKYTVSDGADMGTDGIKGASDLFGQLTDPGRAYYTTTRTVNNEDYVTVTSKNGSEVTLKITDRENTSKEGSEVDLTIELTGQGAMRLQVGVDEGEVLDLSIPEMSLSKMHIDDLDMSNEKNATKAINSLEYALDYVSSARSKLGAYENRLDNTISFVNASDEALTTSYSRIADTDMAEEMTDYTNLQVLTQAGMSMLAQANEFPQQALQLLQ
ncbi:MAG: hypothetical protein J6P45_08715 [Lachnospiraceae bacterium]|nr:hypothetical protein [Lachnospiraceae bacterium]